MPTMDNKQHDTPYISQGMYDKVCKERDEYRALCAGLRDALDSLVGGIELDPVVHKDGSMNISHPHETIRDAQATLAKADALLGVR